MNSSDRNIVLIPGIGGHPEFHYSLINGIIKNYPCKLITNKHGDFDKNAFIELEQHIEYWSSLIQEANLASSNNCLISISFGSNIAQSLPEDILGKFNMIIMISPLILYRLESVILSFLTKLDHKLIAILFGKYLFWWTERKVDDLPSLLNLREKLYSNQRQACIKLWSRFYCLNNAHNFAFYLQKARDAKTYLIFGQDEFLYKYYSILNRLEFKKSDYKVLVTEGDHAFSINNSCSLLNSVLSCLKGEAYESNI